MFAKNYEENENELEYSIFEFKENNSFPLKIQDVYKDKNIFDEEEKDKENQNMVDYHYYLSYESENGNNALEKEEKMTSSKSNPIKEESKENEEPIYYSINTIINLLSDEKFLKFRNKILSNKNINFIPN